MVAWDAVTQCCQPERVRRTYLKIGRPGDVNHAKRLIYTESAQLHCGWTASPPTPSLAAARPPRPPARSPPQRGAIGASPPTGLRLWRWVRLQARRPNLCICFDAQLFGMQTVQGFAPRAGPPRLAPRATDTACARAVGAAVVPAAAAPPSWQWCVLLGPPFSRAFPFPASPVPFPLPPSLSY